MNYFSRQKKIIIMTLSLIISPHPAYILVSKVDGVTSSSIVRPINQDAIVKMQWEDVSQNILHPGIDVCSGSILSSSFIISSKNIPPVAARFKISNVRQTLFNGNEALVCSFSIDGSWPGGKADADISNLFQLIRSESLDGEGSLLLDVKDRILFAGRLTLRRTIEYSPWDDDHHDRSELNTIETAWSILPGEIND